MKLLFGACQKYYRITILIGKEFKLLGFLILGYNFILKHTIWSGIQRTCITCFGHIDKAFLNPTLIKIFS